MNKIFNMFYRAANSDEPGSGLGLALVKKNVTHLGGTIEVESQPGRTVFRMSIPRNLSPD